MDFARAVWINLIDFIVQTKAPGYEAGCFVTFCHSEASEITSSHGAGQNLTYFRLQFLLAVSISISPRAGSLIKMWEKGQPARNHALSRLDQLRNLVTAPSHNMKTRLIMQNAKFYFLLCPKVRDRE